MSSASGYYPDPLTDGIDERALPTLSGTVKVEPVVFLSHHHDQMVDIMRNKTKHLQVADETGTKQILQLDWAAAAVKTTFNASSDDTVRQSHPKFNAVYAWGLLRNVDPKG
jgi:hypothetical protein